MNIKSIFIVVLVISYALSSKAQSTQFKYRVHVKYHHNVFKTIASPLESIVVESGDIVNYEQKFSLDGKPYILERQKTYTNSSQILADKSERSRRYISGEASISIDKEDRSKLNINFFLNAKKKLVAGTIIGLKDGASYKMWGVKSDSTIYANSASISHYNSFLVDKKTLDDKTKERQDLVNKGDKVVSASDIKKIKDLGLEIFELQGKLNDLMWIAYAKPLLFEFDAGSNPINVYGLKYDGDYFVKLENREYESFWFSGGEISALTVPFKIRPKFTKNGIGIGSEFTADFNAGIYMGVSFGKVKYTYRKHEELEPSKWIVSVGPLLSVSKIDIDSTTTLAADKPLTVKKSIATVSPGIGAMISVFNVRLGVFTGWDFAVGQTGKKWDYSGKQWIGFGLGYNLGLIWGAGK